MLQQQKNLNSSFLVCALGNPSSLLPKIYNKNGKKVGEGRSFEWFSDLTFIKRKKKITFLEQREILFCLGDFFPHNPKASIRDLVENYFSYGIPAGR